MNKILFAFAFLIVTGIVKIKAQEPDPVFVENYKTFRDITDSLSSYALYLIPYGSTNKIRLTGAYQSRLSKVFHFLKRNKKIDFTQPDFIIGILIDDQQIEEPTLMPISRNTNQDRSITTVTYRYKVNFLIHTKDRKELRFNLGGIVSYDKNMEVFSQYNEIKDSLSKRGYSLRPPPQPISLTQLPMYPDLQMSTEDYKTLLSKLMDKFTNYYVDRVDN